jgi:hypothetical protein
MSYTVFISGNKKGKFLAYADIFYSTYKEELVPFDATLNDVSSMLTLLNRLATKKKKYVLIVSHGWTDGLWLPLYKATKDESTTIRLASILLMSKMRPTVDKLLNDGKPQAWFSNDKNTKATIAKLKEVFPPHEFKYTKEKDAYAAVTAVKTGGVSSHVNQIQRNVDTLSGNPQQLAALGPEVQAIVGQWWESLLVSSGLNDDKMANKYFKALKAVHEAGINRVEIRGCKIGDSKPSSQVLRIFLGADKLRAPKVVLVTQRVTPKIEKQVTVMKDEHVWTVGQGYVKWDPTDFYRISSLKEWKSWILSKIGKSRKTVGLTMPLMYLDVRPPQYPQDPGFEKLLATFS